MSPERADSAAPADAFRERIIQASLDLLREQGLGALSMREVARRAGVSHQAPYHHFADKEAILAAIAEQGFELLRSRVLGAQANRDEPLYGRILAVGEAYLAFAMEQREHFRVMFRPELVRVERHPSLKNAGDRACALFLEVVRQAVADGLPADESVEALFLLCWSVGHGLACLVLDGPLDVVMPNEDRASQLRGVIRSFGRLLEARVREQQPAHAAAVNVTRDEKRGEQ